MSDTLKGLAPPSDPDLLVGFDTSDDAAVYRISNDAAMISTIDFITPPVDDPYWFGQIAAANSISDIYSMGGRPLTALNVVMFPLKLLDKGILKRILEGGHDKVTQAGAVLAGGHSVDDEEPKYGLSVNGIVHPDNILTNAGAQPGDALVLTKPIGSGVLFNAVRSGKLSFDHIEKDVLPIIASLNDKAIETGLKNEIHACTDVTGFGILGHLMEMAIASQTRFVINHDTLPIYPYAFDMYKKGETTGSNKANQNMVMSHDMVFNKELTKIQEGLLYDPQTSGGLILCLPQEHAVQLVKELRSKGVDDAVCIGTVEKGKAGINLV